MDRRKRPTLSSYSSSSLQSRRKRRRATWPKDVPGVCAVNANFCFTVGARTDDIARYFGNFDNFRASLQPGQSANVVSSGKNGIIFEVQHADVTTTHRISSALKLSISRSHSNPDNLFYEAYVGTRVINAWCRRFPLFVRTYGLYRLRDGALANKAQAAADASRAMTNKDIINLLQGNQLQIGSSSSSGDSSAHVSCAAPRSLALHFEFADRALTLDEFTDDLVEFTVSPAANSPSRRAKLRLFWGSECPSFLFQMYAPLAALRDRFTHYDMHLANILLCRVPSDKYLRMIYHFDDTQFIEIATQYVVKIIDYGRCFTPSSASIRDALCRTKSCGSDCGRSKGHVYINYSEKEARTKQNYITPMHSNQSHDLRAAHLVFRKLILRRRADDPKGESDLDSTSFAGSKVRDILRNVRYDYSFGTPDASSARQTQQHSPPDATSDVEGLQTVKDLFDELYLYCKSEAFQAYTSMMAQTAECIGTLHIYVDNSGRASEYVPEPTPKPKSKAKPNAKGKVAG